MSTQEMLEEAIKLWGMKDIVTIMLSQKRDMEVAIAQVKINQKNKVNIDEHIICV